jgi:hypothetical protein
MRGHWCDIVLNVNALTEDKRDHTKDNFNDELARVFDHFLGKKKIGNFNAKVGKEYIFKSRVGNKNLHEISNYYEVTVVSSATSKI